MQLIIRAIYYTHENHVCDRDLKPGNFVFQTKDPLEKNVYPASFEPGHVHHSGPLFQFCVRAVLQACSGLPKRLRVLVFGILSGSMLRGAAGAGRQV